MTTRVTPRDRSSLHPHCTLAGVLGVTVLQRPEKPGKGAQAARNQFLQREHTTWPNVKLNNEKRKDTGLLVSMPEAARWTKQRTHSAWPGS